MTQRDKWSPSKAAKKYFAFKDEITLYANKIKFVVPESHYHLIMVVPIPKSWTKKRKKDMIAEPHKQRPDKDNFEKAFLDALCEEDSYVWDGRVTKVWGEVGKIIIKNI